MFHRERKNLGFILLIAVLFGMYGCAVQQPSQVKYTDEKLWPVTKEEVVEVERPVSATSGAFPTGEKSSSVIFIEKIVPSMSQVGHPFDLVFRVTNLTNSTVEDVEVFETVHRNFDIKDSSHETRGDISLGNVSWYVGSLGPKETKEIVVSGIPTSEAEDLEFCATNVTYRLPPICMTTTVVQPALSLEKHAPSEILLCDTFKVCVKVTNTGTGLAQNIQLTDSLPSGWMTTDGKTDLVYDIASLHPGEMRDIGFNVRAERAGTYDNMATATAAGGISAQSNTITTVVQQPVLSITKTGPDRRYLGRNVKYDITVSNEGNGPAESTVLTDKIPPNTSFVSASDGGMMSSVETSQTQVTREKRTKVKHKKEHTEEKLWPVTKTVEVEEEVEVARPVSAPSGTVTWNLGTLQPQDSRTVSLTVRAERTGEAENCVTATAVCADAVTACADTDLLGIPAVLLEVIDIADPIEVGGSETYEITVTNQGSATDTGITIVCTLEEGTMEYISTDGPTIGSAVGNVVTFAPLSSLAPKAKATWRLNVRAVNSGDVRIKVTLDTDQLERDVEETESTRFYE